MAKEDYPTGALVEVLREYKDAGGSIEVYEEAKRELKNLLMHLVKRELTCDHSMAEDNNPICPGCMKWLG